MIANVLIVALIAAQAPLVSSFTKGETDTTFGLSTTSGNTTETTVNVVETTSSQTSPEISTSEPSYTTNATAEWTTSVAVAETTQPGPTSDGPSTKPATSTSAGVTTTVFVTSSLAPTTEAISTQTTDASTPTSSMATEVSTPDLSTSDMTSEPLSTTQGVATTQGATTQGKTTQGATTPGATTPGATTSGATTPGATTSGATTPGATTPGTTVLTSIAPVETTMTPTSSASSTSPTTSASPTLPTTSTSPTSPTPNVPTQSTSAAPDVTQSTAQTTTTLPQTTTSTTVTMPTTATTDTECSAGFFGHECAYVCGCENTAEACHPLTGYCVSGCPDGFSGPGCLVGDDPGTDPVVIALAVLLAVFGLLAIILLIFILVGRSRKRKHKPSDRGRSNSLNFDQHTEFSTIANRTRSNAKSEPITDLKAFVNRLPVGSLHMTSLTIGRGRFGSVFMGRLTVKMQSQDVACKTLKENATSKEKLGFYSQLEFYSCFEPHKNVINFLGVSTIAGDMVAAFEMAPHGSLKEFLRSAAANSSAGPPEERHTLQTRLEGIALGVAEGMDHLTKREFVHRELMLKHILVAGDYTAKISGVNTQEGAKEVTSKWMPWTAPEAMAYRKFTSQSDVWSYGILLWGLVTLGKRPYSSIPSGDIYRQVEAGYRLPQPPQCGDAAYLLMTECWDAEPKQRPTFLAIYNRLMTKGAFAVRLWKSDTSTGRASGVSDVNLGAKNGHANAVFNIEDEKPRENFVRSLLSL